MSLLPNYLWPFINCWSMLRISHYNYFPTASCLNATEMVLSSLSTTLTYAFPLQRDINFCSYSKFSSVWGKNISTTNSKSFNAAFCYFWHVFKTPVQNTEGIPQKEKTHHNITPPPTKTDVVEESCSTMAWCYCLSSFLLFLSAHFHFFLL